MKYCKIIENGYIKAISTNTGGVEITKEEADNILALVRSKPIADLGYDYKLKEDLTWELVAVTVIDPAEEEISGNELLTMIKEVL